MMEHQIYTYLTLVKKENSMEIYRNKDQMKL